MNLKSIKYFLFFYILIFLSGCLSANTTVQTIHGHTMGTTYSIKYLSGEKLTSKNQVKIEIDKLLIQINKEMSTYIKNSELSLINDRKDTKWIKLSDRLFNVINKAQEINLLSDGAFDITIGPLVNLWGFGPVAQNEYPTNEKINNAKKDVGFDKIKINSSKKLLKKLNKNIYIDLSAIAKGFGVDEVASLLKNKFKFLNFMIEIGGEVKTLGTKNGKQWQIAIESPVKSTRKIRRIVKLNKMSLATSGNYRNYINLDGKTVNHTINPYTGRPVVHRLASVTVFDQDSCMKADAYATTLMVLGPFKGMEFAKKHNIAAYFIYLDSKAKKLRFKEMSSPKLKSFFNDVF
jgi:FAD:protein FMN transferase